MGRKVHPVGFRLGIIKDWTAKWYAEGERYADLLQEDLAIRQHVRQSMGRAGISDMTIERGFHSIQDQLCQKKNPRFQPLRELKSRIKITEPHSQTPTLPLNHTVERDP